MVIEEAKCKQKTKKRSKIPIIKTTNHPSQLISAFRRRYPNKTPNQRHAPRSNNQPKISSPSNYKNQLKISSIHIVIP